MTISSLALAAKKVIDAAWLNGDAYDLSSQAAFALESTQMLQSPETAAEFEALRARVAELEQAQGSDRERVELLAGFERALAPFCVEPGVAAAAVAAVRDPDREWLLRDAQRLQDRVIELEALAPARNSEDARACAACGSLPEQWCPDCAACEQGCFGGFEGNPCTHANASWGGR